MCSIPFIIAINRKGGLKKAPSCLSFTAFIVKKETAVFQFQFYFPFFIWRC